MVTVQQAEQEPREHLGRDLRLSASGDLAIGSSDDFVKIIFEENLKQAIINRLRTAKGEIFLHPSYGSKLHEIVGAPSTQETLLLARMHVRDALLQEPRIDKILKISPTYREGSAGQVMEIEISVQPIKELEPLNLVFSIFLSGEGELLTEVT